MRKIIIPIQFFDALKKYPPIYRLMWVDWLSKAENLFHPKFSDNLRYDNVPQEKIKECYAIGIGYFQEGIFYDDEIPKQPKSPPKANTGEISIISKEIIDYLNEKAKTNYKAKSSTTIQLISGRLSEGFKKEDFFKVIDNKVEQWKNTEHEQYLRPITLFSKSKFESYLNQKNGTKKSNSTISQIRNAVDEAKSKLFD